MLTGERMERMLAAPSYEECAKILAECGYEDLSSADAAGVDEALSRRRREVFDELSRCLPDTRLVDVFRLKYDYHNIKVLVKAAGAGVEGERLLSDCGRVPPEKLKEAFDEEEYRVLPRAMEDALRASRGVLARTGNPQTADFETDRAYFRELHATADATGSDFLRGYAAVLTDSANLRATVRTARMGKNEDFLVSALVPGGNVSPDRYVQALSAGGEALAALFSASPLKKAAELGAEAMRGGAMTAFELACDNAVTAYLAKAKLVPFGAEPAAEYLALTENEITAARMILTGRLAGISPELIRERLRDINA